MAKRAALPSSLFPFMSVLACTIGALVVLLAIMSLSAVGASGRAETLSEARLEEEAAERERARLAEEEVALAEARWEEIDETLARLGWNDGASAFEIERRLDRIARQRALRAETARLEAEARKFEASLGEIEASVEVLASRRETLPILIDPTGLSRSWQPYFVECTEAGLTAYRARDDVRYFVPRSEIAMIGDLARYLRRVRAEPGALLVLLIRPDGLASAAQLQALAEGAGLRAARLPIPGAGEIDWSLLRRAEGRAKGRG